MTLGRGACRVHNPYEFPENSEGAEHAYPNFTSFLLAPGSAVDRGGTGARSADQEEHHRWGERYLQYRFGHQRGAGTDCDSDARGEHGNDPPVRPETDGSRQ